MSHNSEDHQHGENSNDHVQKVQEKKGQEFMEPWDFQANPSPRFTPMQYPAFSQVMPPNFDLENKGYPYFDDKQMSDRKQQDVQHLDHIDEDHNRMPMHYQFGYYPQMKYAPPPPMFMKYPPQPNQPYMVPQPWYQPQRHQQIIPPPFCYYPPYPEGFQGQNTVSKELQNKVYQLVSFQKVSDFQCNCKKSKCLKLYCECFANNWVCSQSCNCQDCKNRIDNPQERSKAIEEALLRNPDAFAQCFTSKNGAQTNQFHLQPPELKSHKDQAKEQQNLSRKGCNCKKSGCKKKYCECYSSNMKCSELCKCEHCLNRTDAELQEKQDLHSQENADQIDYILNVNKVSSKKKVKRENDEEKSDSQKPVVSLKINLNSGSAKKKKQDKV